MTIEQLDNLKMYIGAMSGALLIQQDAIETAIWPDRSINSTQLARIWDTNRDLARQINKLKRLISEVKA